MYIHYRDPSDRGVRLIQEMALGTRAPFLDAEGESVTVSDALWDVVSFFRLHVGMVQTSPTQPAFEWYHNPLEGLAGHDPNVDAHFAAELYLKLEVSHSPRLIAVILNVCVELGRHTQI